MKHPKNHTYPLNQSYLKGWKVALQNFDITVKEQWPAKKRAPQAH